MLCAILTLDHDTNEVSLQYFNIQLAECTLAMVPRYGNQDRAAVVLTMLPDATKQDKLNALAIAADVRSNVTRALVEFPNVLYAGFANVLHTIQLMSYRWDDGFAFGKYIAPQPDELANHQDRKLQVDPPSYARQPGFAFDLQSLTNKPDSMFTLQDLTGDKLEETVHHVTQNTTLDAGQAVALLSSLNRELSFTQGPPGCGKTFLAANLVRVLLASRPAVKKKPILLVARTNHALDSLLGNLRDAGVIKLLRVGNSSKEDWTNAINLRTVGRQNRFSMAENHSRFMVLEEKAATYQEMDVWCKDLAKEALTGLPCWSQISDIVRNERPQVYSQLLTDVENIEIQGTTYDYWARGGDLATIDKLHTELLSHLNSDTKDGDAGIAEAKVKNMIARIANYTRNRSADAGKDSIWHLSLDNRQKMLKEWADKVDKESMAKQLFKIHKTHQGLLKEAKEIANGKDIRTMLEHNVVGLTTTACAGRWEMLQEVGFEIMICEEAGEVLEAHALCTMLPTLKHSINIGDPLQLPPSVEEQALIMESQRGKQYRLNESLFERLMKPKDPQGRSIPTTRLHIQRRMQPEIANITRLTYPFLKDHGSTQNHPVPKGLKQHLWWLDHKVPEDVATGASKSVTNTHEVQIIARLVRYLLRGSDYSPSDIAVLTPYSGQLLKVHEALSKECGIWVNEQDREFLIEKGAIEADVDESQRHFNLPMNELLRLATIDNFQGEQAKVIILCTVRSGNKLGFVKSPNRINVAMSRAQHGLYIVGNSSTLQPNPLWSSIISIFKQNDAIGNTLQLQCDRHPEHFTLASKPSDFDTFTQCKVSCNQILSCGHKCTQQCHDPSLHSTIPCTAPCTKTLSCGHECENLCGNKCSPCTKTLEVYNPCCGHFTTQQCGSNEQQPCTHFEGHLNQNCNRHTVPYICGSPSVPWTCNLPCNETLICGHSCTGKCGHCVDNGEHAKCDVCCVLKSDGLRAWKDLSAKEKEISEAMLDAIDLQLSSIMELGMRGCDGEFMAGGTGTLVDDANDWKMAFAV